MHYQNDSIFVAATGAADMGVTKFLDIMTA